LTHAGAPEAAAARTAIGRQARRSAPRSSHADWRPAPDRPDPVEVLRAQAGGRVAELLPLRYGRMLASAFAFYRGAAAIMASDLAGTPWSGLRTQLCGDAHLANFGSFASPERELVFDVNDFDETLPGPWEWDVKRLAASVGIAGRDRGFTDRQIGAAVLGTVRAYREAMLAFARQANLDVWYARLTVAEIARPFAAGVAEPRLVDVERRLRQARLDSSDRVLRKLTTTVDGKVSFRSEPPLLVRAAELPSADDRRDAESCRAGLLDGGYRDSLPAGRRALPAGYRYVDMARKVVGVGSVGTRDWVVLLHGRDGRDPLLLQAKEADASVLEAHLGAPAAGNHAERVVTGQELMQAAGDVFLGWYRARHTDGADHDYYVRRIADGKGAIDVSTLLPAGLAAYGRLCGWTLARAHARAGDRIAIAGYLGRGDNFDRAVAAFADRYADRNEADYQALRRAVAAGRVPAAKG
jgi:uncharacterized protein (DUF2252 family)